MYPFLPSFLPPFHPSVLPPFHPSVLPPFRFYSERAPDTNSVHAAAQATSYLPRIVAVPIRTALPYRSQYTNSVLLFAFPTPESRIIPTPFTPRRIVEIEDWCCPFRTCASQTSFIYIPEYISVVLLFYTANNHPECSETLNLVLAF